jgi:hypothetical protein
MMAPHLNAMFGALRSSPFVLPATGRRACSADAARPKLFPHKSQLFLHVAPDGDAWTGPTIFAAKHLPTDFVVSVPIPDGFDIGRLTEAQRQRIYDDKALPIELRTLGSEKPSW